MEKLYFWLTYNAGGIVTYPNGMPVLYPSEETAIACGSELTAVVRVELRIPAPGEGGGGDE